jgi:hypothetical protein
MRVVSRFAPEVRRLRRLRAIANWTVPIYFGTLAALRVMFGPYVYLPAGYERLGVIALIVVAAAPFVPFIIIRLRFWSGAIKCAACDAPFIDVRDFGQKILGFIPSECWLCHYNVVTGGVTSNNELERTRNG